MLSAHSKISTATSRFKHVYFKYDPHSPRKTLENIDFEVSQGKVTAIVDDLSDFFGTSGNLRFLQISGPPRSAKNSYRTNRTKIYIDRKILKNHTKFGENS